MRKLYYFEEYSTGFRTFVAANNKYQVIQLMFNVYNSSDKDTVKLIGRFYGAKYKALNKPTIIQ